MLQNNSILWVVDNSGAKLLKVIGSYPSNRKYSKIGDIVSVSIKKCSPKFQHSKNEEGKERKKTFKALVVGTRRYYRRQNDSWIKFSKNCAVLFKHNSKDELMGTKIFFPLLAEFGDWGYKKLFSLTKRII